MTNIYDLADVDFLPILADFDEGVIISDTTGKILFYNHAQSKMDGLDPAYVVGRKVTEIYHLDENTSKIMLCLKNCHPIIGELFSYSTRQGKVVNTIHSVFPLKKNKKLIGAICFVKDYHLLDKTIASPSSLMTQEKPDLGNGTRFTFADIIGGDPKFLKCVNNARMAANSPSPIMFLGETGTGKEVFAQSVHNYSSRRKKPFIAINCAAIPENLLEGILFGTSRGAFTGALDKSGLFEQASGGTLFMDELDSMPMALQVKLLRVLQEKKVRRVGSLNEVKINAKIISTISQNPRHAVQEGVLRLDLFYRLGVVFISIPAIRERLTDLKVLTTHFIYKINLILGKKVKAVSEDIETFFENYTWPGNVRELEHVIEGSMNMIGDEETLETRHLPSYFINEILHNSALKKKAASGFSSAKEQQRVANEVTEPLALHGTIPETPCKSLSESQADTEKKTICQALACSEGNVSKAARSLGISRQLLHYKIKKFRISKDTFSPPDGS